MASHDDTTNSGVGQVSGLGVYKYNGTTPKYPLQLQSAQMNIISDSSCASTWPIAALNGSVCVMKNAVTLCQGLITYIINTQTFTFTISGDGGIPLVVNNTLLGVASQTDASIGLCSANRPDIFSRVSKVRFWTDLKASKITDLI